MVQVSPCNMARTPGSKAARLFTTFWLALLVTLGVSAGAHGETMRFSKACTPGKRISIAVAGDLLFHRKLQVQAYARNGNFRRFFEPVKDVLQAADLAYGNLEGPAARGVALGGKAVEDTGKRIGRVYGAPKGLLAFNYHPSVIPDLAASGFDILSTANNHSMDRGSLGVDRTIDELRRNKMPFTGTRKRGETPKRWSTVTKTGGLSVAWLACTYSTNGIPDRNRLVRHCYKETDAILSEIRALGADPGIDAVLLTPHWGNEYHHKPGKRERTLGRQAIEAGATAVLGAHPHVLQPWEKVVTKDGREGLIIYSTGNFVSNQRRTSQRAGILGMLQLVKPARSGAAEPGATGGSRHTAADGGQKAHLAAAGYMPTWVEIDGKGHRVSFNTSSKGRRGDALARTLGLLPAGNRMQATAPFIFPSNCAGSQYAAFDGPKPHKGWKKNPYRKTTLSKSRKRSSRSSKAYSLKKRTKKSYRKKRYKKRFKKRHYKKSRSKKKRYRKRKRKR